MNEEDNLPEMAMTPAEENVSLSADPAPDTWSGAFQASPGPKSWREAGVLSAKGLCMGAADIVPGVSGGTIAFITGIYEDFLAAISSVDATAIRLFFGGKWKDCLARIHLRFLVALLLGIGIAVVSLAKVVHHALDLYPIQTWGFFFGLIVASIIILAREVKGWSVPRALLLIGGAAFAWWFTGLIPGETPDSLWFIFLCGVISICAMVLPGISGSFLLVILGKYVYITGMINDLGNPKSWLVLGVFACGWAVGISGFSRFLKWLLARWHEATMCVLTGFMIGALRKVWPWKQQVMVEFYKRQKEIDGVMQTITKEKVVKEDMIWPWEYTVPYPQKQFLREGLERVELAQQQIAQESSHLAPAIGLAILGVLLVLAIEWWASSKKVVPLQAEQTQ